MPKRIIIRKNTTESRERVDGEESQADNASMDDASTVRRLTGEIDDMQSVVNVTETVTEERQVEEIPLETREKTPVRPSKERRELTETSERDMEHISQREKARESPRDHQSDPEADDEESSPEDSRNAVRRELINEFREIMNEAMDKLLRKPAKKQVRRNVEPVSNTTQEQRRKTIRKEKEVPSPREISRNTDDERNSVASLRTMDTERHIQYFLRTESQDSERVQRKVENTVDYWTAEEKRAGEKRRKALELQMAVEQQTIEILYAQQQPREVIAPAEAKCTATKHTLEGIQRVKKAKIGEDLPYRGNAPSVHKRQRNAANDTRVSQRRAQERTPQPIQMAVSETERYRSPEVEITSVYRTEDQEHSDPIMRMVQSALEENRDDNPEESIIARTRLTINPPEEYSGSADLEVYETFIAGVLRWLRLHGLLGDKYTETQVQFLGTRLKGNASEWFTRNVERPGRPIKDWSLEAVIDGLQKQFLNSLTHRQASNKFDTLEQGQKTVQELIQELTKYAARMVQYPDDYSFRRRLISALRPSLQKEVLRRGITAEFSSMQDILEKAKDVEDSSRYDIGSRMSQEAAHNSMYAAHRKSSRRMIRPVPKGTVIQPVASRPPPKPNRHTSTSTRRLPEATGKQPSKEGELKCYECGQKGHLRPQCPKLKGRSAAAIREDDPDGIVNVVDEDREDGAKDDALDEDDNLRRDEDLNESSDEDEEYSWDEQEYKSNYVRFISNESITEQQMRVASASVDKLAEPVYDHRSRIKEGSRPLRKRNENQPISVFWEIGGVKAHCLIDSGCEGTMLSPDFIRAAKITTFPLEKPIGIQLAVTGSKSVINYGANATIKIDEETSKEYFDVVNIDYYDAILGTPFLRKYGVLIDFINNCLKIRDKVVRNQANDFKVGEGNPLKKKKMISMKALKTEESKTPRRDSE